MLLLLKRLWAARSRFTWSRIRHVLSCIDWGDIGRRSIKTFWQAFFPAIALETFDVLSAKAWVTVILIAGPPAISAAWNVFWAYIHTHRDIILQEAMEEFFPPTQQ